MEYRFIGSEATVGRIKMNKFGQRFAMSEEMGLQARKGGVPLLTEEEFATFKFNDKDLKVWADPFMSPFDMPSDPDDAEEKVDFLRKRDAALLMYRDIRQGLLEPESKYIIEHKGAV